jgi:hypothetical protein
MIAFLTIAIVGAVLGHPRGARILAVARTEDRYRTPDRTESRSRH